MTATIRPIVLVLLVGAGCTPRLYSPPSRGPTLESARPVGKGRTGVNLEVSKYDVALNGLAGRLRHGVREDLDVTADATVVTVDRGYTPGHVVAARVGAKYAPGAIPLAAIVAGVGSGSAPGAGSFASADVGFVLTMENCHFVPTGGYSYFVSRPFRDAPVFVQAESEEVDTPRETRGHIWQLGFKIPVAKRCPKPPTASIVIGFGGMHFEDGDTTDDGDGDKGEDDITSFIFGLEVNL